MKKLSQSHQFLKDVKRMRKRGKDIKKLQSVVNKLANSETLHPKHRDHPLTGEWNTCRDCPKSIHIYYTDANTLRLERTGSHSDLFKRYLLTTNSQKTMHTIVHFFCDQNI